MKPDILALIDKAKDSLGAARILIRDGYFDFAASRAYYAIFYIAEAMLLQLGLSYSKHDSNPDRITNTLRFVERKIEHDTTVTTDFSYQLRQTL